MNDRTALRMKERAALAVAGATVAAAFAALYGGIIVASCVDGFVVYLLGGFVFLFLLGMAGVINVVRNRFRQSWLRADARLDVRAPLLFLRPFADSDLAFTPRTQG